ncbi:hypothetical protein OF83DRAFT_1154759 [Amylostereum chailletii]|nr:hypothetical protein OF83DRAFT_1154759 [Amylostereum chailletii]
MVVGSESNVIIGGKSVYIFFARYPYSCASADGVLPLMGVLCRTHLQDLLGTTVQIHYEVFRSLPCPPRPCPTALVTAPTAASPTPFATPLLLPHSPVVYLYLHLIM